MQKNVYLTFDDGIEPGTAEVLEVLRRNHIRATFFITGINTLYTVEENRQTVVGVFNQICNDHVVANHSFSHAHGFYSSYYSKGLLINNVGKRISVLEDFIKNESYFREQLGICPAIFKKIGRLPGRNTWCLSADTLSKVFLKKNIDRDSLLATEELSNHGYDLFVWNDEWKMDFTFATEGRIARDKSIHNGVMDYSDPRIVYPKFDMYSKMNIDKDRVSESWEEVVGRIIASPLQNYVLLLHDRAFRYSKHRTDTHDLELLIKYLKSFGVVFKGLDTYNQNRSNN
jgi:peptidoglycan/xylan/chitin deacetylase (PgdA/CDA1 family)